jgi:putative transposase
VPSQILRNDAVRFMAAKTRQMKKLAKAPTKKNRSNANTVTITDELFHFVPDPATGALRLFLGILKSIRGELPFKAHRAYGVPKTLCVRRLGHRD